MTKDELLLEFSVLYDQGPVTADILPSIVAILLTYINDDDIMDEYARLVFREDCTEALELIEKLRSKI